MFLSMLQQMLRGALLISFSKLLIDLCLLMVNTNKISFVVLGALFFYSFYSSLNLMYALKYIGFKIFFIYFI